MSFFPSYESISAISSLPPEDRLSAFKRAHSELKSVSPEYKRECTFYVWAISIIIGIGLIPMPLAIVNGWANFFVSIWSIVSVIPIFLLASKHQRMMITEIDSYLKRKNG